MNGSPPNPEIQYWYYEDRNDYDDWLAVSPLKGRDNHWNEKLR